MAASVILLQAAVVYMSGLQSFFKTMPLSLESMTWVLVPGVVVFVTLELEKLIPDPKSKEARHV